MGAALTAAQLRIVERGMRAANVVAAFDEADNSRVRGDVREVVKKNLQARDWIKEIV